jgi:IS605 OrfB family transposase
MYNNIELMGDKNFIKDLRNKFYLIDAWFMESIKNEAETKYKQLETFNKKKSEKIIEIEKIISTKKYKNKKHLYKLKNKLAYLKKSINNKVVFGGRTLLQEVTKLKQEYNKTRDIDTYNRYLSKLNKFKAKRILPIYSVGEMYNKFNRKFNFDLINNKLIFKPNRKTKIDLEFISSNKQQSILNKLQENVGLMPISVRLDNKHIYIIFDEEKLFNYEFKQLDYYKDIKNTKDKDIRKDIFKKYIQEQNSRKLKNKIKDRYCSVDLNPQYIGFNIIDKEGFKIIHKEVIDLTKLGTKLRLSSSDHKQVKQNNKRKHEITIVWKHIFDICKHYRVSNFVIEDLNFKDEPVNTEGKEFNRKTKNLWHRTLTAQLITKYCNMNGINLIEVNPAYSSFIGNLTYSYFDPLAASLELARRGMTKYEKNNKQFGSVDSINLEKVKSYLLGENVQYGIEDMSSIPKLFKLFIGNKLKYRNELDSGSFLENHLISDKSKVKCYNFA